MTVILKNIDIAVLVDFSGQGYKFDGFRKRFRALIEPTLLGVESKYRLNLEFPIDFDISRSGNGDIQGVEACYEIAEISYERTLQVADDLVKGTSDAMDLEGLITVAVSGELRITTPYRVMDGVPERDS